VTENLNTKVYIGIDPGQKGAIAALYEDGSAFMWDMPKTVKGIDEILSCYFKKQNCICCLEKAQPMPKQGVVGVFTYGAHYGGLKAVLEITGIPYQEVRPAKWKKEFSLSKNKKAAIQTALQLFPNKTEDDFKGIRGGVKDGRAEALLMAEYARRNFR
jgi:crossover junction endodeoxyribonuclease RuvC